MDDDFIPADELPSLDDDFVPADELPSLDDDIVPADEDEGLLPSPVEDNIFGGPESEGLAGRSFDRATSNVGVPFIPFADFNDWINAQKPVYSVVY